MTPLVGPSMVSPILMGPRRTAVVNPRTPLGTAVENTTARWALGSRPITRTTLLQKFTLSTWLVLLRTKNEACERLMPFNETRSTRWFGAVTIILVLRDRFPCLRLQWTLLPFLHMVMSSMGMQQEKFLTVRLTRRVSLWAGDTTM